MQQGWIKLHRSLVDWEWYKDPNTFRLFLHCLLKANHQDKQWQGKTIKRGTFITSLDTLSHELGLSVKQIRTAISKLERTSEVAKKGQSKYTVIQVINYDKYQDEGKQEDTQRASEGQTRGKQRATTKNDKNDKNEEYFFNKREELNIELANSSTMIFGIAQRCKTRKINFDQDLLKDLIPLFTNSLNNEDLERRIDEQRRHCANWVLIEIEKIKKNESKKSSHDKSKESYQQTANAIFNTKWDEKSEPDDF